MGTLLASVNLQAQVNAVEFGKNRVQYKKFNWQYYQSPNFNTYFSQDGLALGKYVSQVAELELQQLENFIEEGLQRRINVVVYNSFEDLQQSNIGESIDWQSTGGVTKLVNNKMIVYFTGDHNHLKKQIREGIARVLLENQLFGEDLGEFAANQALLDLPKWLTDGYIKFAAENWNTELDDQLRDIMINNSYKNFYQFAFYKPELAGQAFWFFISEKYKIENVPYFLYLARVYKNLNTASMRIAKKKFKALLAEFMEYEQEKYYLDMRQRRNVPKGTVAVVEEISKRKNFFRFSPNPAPRSQTYAVVEFRNGQYRVVLNENFIFRKELLKYGVRSNDDEINPNFPQIAWDPKGTRLAVLYKEKGKIKLFVYDVVRRYKPFKQELPMFEQVQDMKYMLDANTLLFSAVRNGQTDIYTYKIEEQKLDQITNDIYDDLDATFVHFPNKTGIIYSSNRPSPNAPSGDSVLPNNRYNIFMVNNWNNKDYRHITQLTNMQYGDARFPMQYNTYHFTFVSDENGIHNRYAGFFSTKGAGLDTLVIIGEDVLRNPDKSEVDSTLRLWGKNDIDSVAFVAITSDSAYVFPLTNYLNSLRETKIAGDQGLVSEVTEQFQLKYLYKLKVNETALKRRNVNARPTEFRKRQIQAQKTASGKATVFLPGADTASKKKDVFQTEFEKDTSQEQISNNLSEEAIAQEPLLRSARLFDYKLKFFSDYIVAGFNNAVLVNKFQSYQGGAGPVNLSNNNVINGLIRMGTSDLFEDVKFTGGFRVNPGLDDFEYLFNFQYLKKKVDWGLTYYRTTERNPRFLRDPNSLVNLPDPYNRTMQSKLASNLYQVMVKYPFDRVRSLRAIVGMRSDRYIVKANPDHSLFPGVLGIPDTVNKFALTHIEYVYDNVLAPALNIWHGLRYKVYLDWNTQLGRVRPGLGRSMFNLGFDARHYLPIYRNITWAVRAGADFSWADQKVVYYLGGVDGWLFPKFNNSNPPAQDQTYAFQSLAVNLRGFRQNVANGNNAMVINSEIRVPVFTTFFNKPINNAFLRNFQLTQFIDLGSAWNGAYNKLERPTAVYTGEGTPVVVRLKAPGIGPFIGSYGFGARSTLLGYFLRADLGWPMWGFFRDKPMFHLAMGLDF